MEEDLYEQFHTLFIAFERQMHYRFDRLMALAGAPAEKTLGPAEIRDAVATTQHGVQEFCYEGAPISTAPSERKQQGANTAVECLSGACELKAQRHYNLYEGNLIETGRSIPGKQVMERARGGCSVGDIQYTIQYTAACLAVRGGAAGPPVYGYAVEYRMLLACCYPITLSFFRDCDPEQWRALHSNKDSAPSWMVQDKVGVG